MLLWDNAFIRTDIVFRKFVPRGLLDMWGFPALYLGLLTNEIEGKHTTQTCHTVIVFTKPA